MDRVETTRQKFRDLEIGDRFAFAGRVTADATRQYVKTGERTYASVDGVSDGRVGVGDNPVLLIRAAS